MLSKVSRSPEPGLLSVLISAGDDGAALQATLASLAGQPQRPLQLVVVTSGSLARAEELARLQADRGTFAIEVHAHPSSDSATRTNAALARARGQFVAFFEAGDSVEPQHFRQQVRAL